MLASIAKKVIELGAEAITDMAKLSADVASGVVHGVEEAVDLSSESFSELGMNVIEGVVTEPASKAVAGTATATGMYNGQDIALPGTYKAPVIPQSQALSQLTMPAPVLASAPPAAAAITPAAATAPTTTSETSSAATAA